MQHTDTHEGAGEGVAVEEVLRLRRQTRPQHRGDHTPGHDQGNGPRAELRRRHLTGCEAVVRGETVGTADEEGAQTQQPELAHPNGRGGDGGARSPAGCPHQKLPTYSRRIVFGPEAPVGRASRKTVRNDGQGK